MLHKSHKQLGYILIAVLLFLQIISAIGIFLLSSAGRELKIIQVQRQYNQNQVISDNILKMIESQVLLGMTACQIQKIDSVRLANLSNNWWKNHACNGEWQGRRYYYVVEVLGQYPCIHIHTGPMIAEYLRISLRLVSEQIKMIQSTLVKPVTSQEICQDRAVSVEPCRQMQRIIG